MSGKPAAKKDNKGELRVPHAEGKSRERMLAEVALDPATGAACNVLMFARGTVGPLEATDLLEVLLGKVREVRKGEMAGPEAMLVTQAQSLDAIFTELARRSALNMGEYIEASEKYMRLALKAQAQCRATIETLAAIKNPPLVIAKQANFANGPQQVNNGTTARAGVSDNQPNELLEQSHEQRLDPGASGTPGSSDPQLVPVAALDRAA